MDDIRGDFLRPPHDTTPTAVIANKIKWFDPLEAVKHSKGDSMDYIAQFWVMNPHPPATINKIQRFDPVEAGKQYGL